MAEFSVNAKKTGILENTNYLDKWQGNPDVLYARPLVEVRGFTATIEHTVRAALLTTSVHVPCGSSSHALLQQGLSAVLY